MQKIITVTCNSFIKDDSKFIETQFPEVNKLLEDGYTVSQVIPIIKPANTGHYYDIIFILNK